MTSSATSQINLSQIKTIEVHLDSTFWPNYSDVRGFCYGGGYFWAVTWWGYIVKIDTTGQVRGILHTSVNGAYGAICYDADTLWVVHGVPSKIFPLDLQGAVLGPPIDLSNLKWPLNDDIWGIVKDQDSFWLVHPWTPLLYKIDRTGRVNKDFANQWYCGVNTANITMLNGKILMMAGVKSQISNPNVFAVDTSTGYVSDEWIWPGNSGTPLPLGFATGENCIWSIQVEAEGNGTKLTLRKFSTPPPSPPPGIPTTIWGDFRIVDWSYCPLTPNAIEGTYGLGYDQRQRKLWIGDGVATAYAYGDRNDLVFPLIQGYNLTPNIPYDLCFTDSSMWTVNFWRDWVSPQVSEYRMRADSLVLIRQWDVNMAQTHGIATDGTYLWISGRDSARTTSENSNDIRKYDFSGNLISAFHYPDLGVYNYEDLTWHDGTLWGITAKLPFRDTTEIHRINPNTGEVVRRYKTGWHPFLGLWANLASDGQNLVAISTTSSAATFEYYQNSRLRVLRLNPVESGIADRQRPIAVSLGQNYPNPFNPSTTIRYGLPQQSSVSLSVFNTLGQLISTLVNGSVEAGYHEVRFDATNLASGVYFYRIQAGGFVQTMKCVLLR